MGAMGHVGSVAPRSMSDRLQPLRAERTRSLASKKGRKNAATKKGRKNAAPGLV
jgi:hypothetical protein